MECKYVASFPDRGLGIKAPRYSAGAKPPKAFNISVTRSHSHTGKLGLKNC